VKIRKYSDKAPGKRRARTSKAALPALVAAGSGLAVGSAAALELGELQVQSTLGQPLRASIAYALSPSEVIDDRCIAVRSAGGGLPGPRNATASVSKGVITITGTSPVMEPVLSANIVVDCRHSAHVSRNYLMFIDPPQRVAPVERRSMAKAVVASAAAPVARPAPGPLPATAPVTQDSRYRVQPGDSLSGIVGRLEASDVAGATAMAAILDANPGAFIGGNPDRLKAGSWLDIPSFADGTDVAVAGVATADTREGAAESYQGAETLQPDAKIQIPAAESLPDARESGADGATGTATDSAATAEAIAEETAADADYSAAYAGLVSGDIVVDESAAADVAPARPNAEPARVVKPSAGTRIVGTPDPAGSTWNQLIWAVVALISAFGAYLLFWPKLRERFRSTPVGADDRIPPQAESAAPITMPESEITVHEIRPPYDNVDFDLSDDSPTEENLELDVDLIDGTGFHESADVEVNRDFVFAATMDLDTQLSETASTEDTSSETDIIQPPERPEEYLVVDDEVLPEDDDDYDISMVVDATKMPDPAEVTERDLRAVPVDDTGQTLINDDYTIIDEIGQGILERDYEDELTARQMLDAKIEKAASELTETIGEDELTAIASLDDEPDTDAGKIVGFEDDTSTAMRLTNLSELDLATTLDAQNDDNGNDRDVAASGEDEDKTVEMPQDRGGARAR
jgi:hypothetical protein